MKYSCHFSNVGWSDFYNNGELCGSDNAGSSIEAFKVELVGNIANSYNIYYCSYTKISVGLVGLKMVKFQEQQEVHCLLQQ